MPDHTTQHIHDTQSLRPMGVHSYFRTVLTYTIIGLLFGACFPIGAIILEALIKSTPLTFSNIIHLHELNKLLYMIDSAPLFLGIFAMFGGLSKGKADQAYRKMALAMTAMDQTNSENESLLDQFRTSQQMNERLIVSIRETCGQLLSNAKILSQDMNELYTSDLELEKYIESVEASTQELNAITRTLLDQFHYYDDSVIAMQQVTQQVDRDLTMHLSHSKDIVEEVASSVKQMTKLDQDAMEVEQVAHFIAGIANQIRMLALNASIEAQHAGEAGKGFMVVAKEVQKLSNQTGEATTRIGGTIKKVTGSIHEIREKMALVKESGSELLEGSQSLREAFVALQKDIGFVKDSSRIANEQMEEQNIAINNIYDQIHHVAELSHDRHEVMERSEKTMEISDEHIRSLNDVIGNS